MLREEFALVGSLCQELVFSLSVLVIVLLLMKEDALYFFSTQGFRGLLDVFVSGLRKILVKLLEIFGEFDGAH